MRRRSFVITTAAALTTLIAPGALARIACAQIVPGDQIAPGPRTRWRVRTSEGFDAIAFLGPLSGGELYTRYYAEDVAAFAPRLPDAVRRDVAALWASAGADGFGLLGPSLCVLFSAGNDATMDTLLAALAAPDERILPSYKASPYWDPKDWRWFTTAAPRLTAVFTAMRDAGFARFRAERVGAGLDARVGEVQRGLDDYDVVSWQEKLTGRAFDPVVEVVLLQFAKPHGIKVQGQTFLQAADYDTATTVRIAAHEMLHPPVAKDGAAARAALAVLAHDPLMMRVVREHDPRWGYTSLEGLFDEDLAQALDQLIGEALGVARNPADRWRKSDDGMHVLAGALYGLLRQDRWVETGGSIEAWLADAARTGRLAPGVLHASAARVLERPADKLWPLAAAG